jgi:broad specificity phosphatase PhoE
MMPRFFLVRHGATAWNVEGRLQGQRDIRLNALGRQQATACGAILKTLIARDRCRPEDFDYVSSPLARARETMELMRDRLDLDKTHYRVDTRLMELSFGRWEGSTIAEIRARDPLALAARERDKWRFTPPCGESYETLAVRVGAWLATLAKPTIAVAHGGTARSLMALLDIAPAVSTPTINIEQGVVYEFGANALTIHR